MLDVKKNTLLTFKGICMIFLLELIFFILSHPLTSKQPPKVVQIHMTHSVDLSLVIQVSSKAYINTRKFQADKLHSLVEWSFISAVKERKLPYNEEMSFLTEMHTLCHQKKVIVDEKKVTLKTN